VAALADARRDAVLGHLQAQAGVQVGQVISGSHGAGKLVEGRVQCPLESRAL